MEKVFGFFVLVVSCLLSCVSFAQIEETTTYGTPISNEPLSFGDWNYMVNGISAGGASQTAGSAYSNYRADLAKKEAKRKCKQELEVELRNTRAMVYSEYQSNTSTCNNYHILAAGSTIVGAVASVPTFGFTAAAGVSGAASFATAGLICQQNADGRYAELTAYNESVIREFDIRVCDSIK